MSHITKLYPNTTNAEILEKLAGVPAGTHKLVERLRLHQLNMQRKHPEHADAIDDDMDRFLHNDAPNLGKYDDFRTFGWGRVNSYAYDLIKELEMSEVWGNIFTIKDTERMLKCMGVKLPDDVDIIDLNGIYWS